MVTRQTDYAVDDNFQGSVWVFGAQDWTGSSIPKILYIVNFEDMPIFTRNLNVVCVQRLLYWCSVASAIYDYSPVNSKYFIENNINYNNLFLRYTWHTLMEFSSSSSEEPSRDVDVAFIGNMNERRKRGNCILCKDFEWQIEFP